MNDNDDQITENIGTPSTWVEKTRTTEEVRQDLVKLLKEKYDFNSDGSIAYTIASLVLEFDPGDQVELKIKDTLVRFKIMQIGLTSFGRSDWAGANEAIKEYFSNNVTE